MKTARLALLAVACIATLPACQQAGQAAGSIASTAIEQARKELDDAGEGMDKAHREIEQARHKMATENLSLNRSREGTENLPKAEITPGGELLVDGKAVPTTPEQKRLVLAYREQLLGVAGDGMAIGIEGAKLGMHAAGSALAALAGGQSADDIGKQAEQSVKERIKPQVEKLCARLPELLKTQEALAAALPAFAPYAGMSEADVAGCRDDARRPD